MMIYIVELITPSPTIKSKKKKVQSTYFELIHVVGKTP